MFMTNSIQTLTSPVPKVITPGMHAVADYSAAAGLVAMGAYLRNKNSRASAFAFANAGLVLLTSLFTNYPGGVARGMTFKMHGTMDVMQAGLLALGPTLLGFTRTKEADMFYGQAALEMGVVAATDWDAATGVTL